MGHSMMTMLMNDLGLLLRTEAHVMMPNGIDFLFFLTTYMLIYI